MASREDIWVTSKLWNTYHAAEHVPMAMQKSLDDLGLDYGTWLPVGGRARAHKRKRESASPITSYAKRISDFISLHRFLPLLSHVHESPSNVI